MFGWIHVIELAGGEVGERRMHAWETRRLEIGTEDRAPEHSSARIVAQHRPGFFATVQADAADRCVSLHLGEFWRGI
jgi:hypothetical protein